MWGFVFLIVFLAEIPERFGEVVFQVDVAVWGGRWLLPRGMRQVSFEVGMA